LQEDISLNDVAGAACYSLYHFHRIFPAAVGDSVKEYIRKRRMTEAARELVTTSHSILSIAVDYGYGSQEAFSRSFMQSYGMAPGVFRRRGCYYALRDKMSEGFLLFEYNRRRYGARPRIVEHKGLRIIGKKISVRSGGPNFKEIPLFWSEWLQHRYERNIPCKINEQQMFGVCAASASAVFDYIIGCEVKPRAEVPPGFISYTVPGGNYAVFDAWEPVTESVQKTWDYIFSTWLPEAGFEYTENDSFELYYNENNAIRTEIYLPVREKNV
jgi:AraC family transcriptional regulator